MHSPSEVEYGVITNHAEEWDEFKDSQNETGIYSIREDTTQDFLHSLVSWAHNNKGEKSSVLLLIDNLEPAARLNLEAEQNLRWLLLRGPSRRVWPIVTLNAGRARTLEALLGFFRTRLFGCIRDPSDSQFVTGISDELLDDLDPGSQFTMREGDHWLNFRIPNFE